MEYQIYSVCYILFVAFLSITYRIRKTRFAHTIAGKIAPAEARLKIQSSLNFYVFIPAFIGTLPAFCLGVLIFGSSSKHQSNFQDLFYDYVVLTIAYLVTWFILGASLNKALLLTLDSLIKKFPAYSKHFNAIKKSMQRRASSSVIDEIDIQDQITDILDEISDSFPDDPSD